MARGRPIQLLITLIALAILAGAIAGCGDSGGDKTTVSTGTDTTFKVTYPVRITYVADSPFGKPVTSAQLDQGIGILQQRAKALGLNDTRITKKASDGEIVITYAPDDYAKPANSQLPVQGRLFFYDFNADVIGSPAKPIGDVFTAVSGASKRAAVDSADNTTGVQYYLFGATRNYRGGPTGSRAVLLDRYNGEQPPESQVLKVQPGTVVVLAHPLSNALDPKAFNGDFVMRDRPQLDNSDITNPRYVSSDGKPGVQFDFTIAGGKKFQQLTKQVARAGAGGPPHSVAAVLDSAILSRVPIDSKQFPNGIDPANGAVLSGDLTETQAKDLAAVLDSGPLPFRLHPVLQEQVQGQ